VVVQLLEVFCCLLDVFFAGSVFATGGDILSTGERKPVRLEAEQRQSKKCEFGGCRSLNFRSTDYCWKHQEGKPHQSDGPIPIRTTGESSWWEPKEE